MDLASQLLTRYYTWINSLPVSYSAARFTSIISNSGFRGDELLEHIYDQYGIVGAWTSVFFPAIPYFIRTVEDRVLNGTEESIAKFRKDQESLLTNIGMTAAIISQVTVTTIQLNNIEQVHFTVRGLFYSSLVISLSAAVTSFLKHRDITSMNNFDIRLRLKHERQSDPFNPKKLDLMVVLALFLPYALLNTAVSIYFISLLLFLILSWTQLPDVNGTKIENRNILIFVIFSFLACELAVIRIKASRLYLEQESKVSIDTRTLIENCLDHYPPQGKEAFLRALTERGYDPHIQGPRGPSFMDFEKIEYSYATTRSYRSTEGAQLGAVTGWPPNFSPSELVAAMTEAANSNKAATAAIQAVAAQLERISTGSLVQVPLAGDNKTTTNEADTDAITPVQQS